jgi:hypothetical protein
MAGKNLGSVLLAPANLGGRPKFDLESLRVPLKAPEAAALSPPARGLGRMLESSLQATDSALRAESKLNVGDLSEIRVEDLPEPLRAPFKCVQGLEKIGVELSKPGDLAEPKVLTEALQDIHAANPKLASRVREAAAAAAERKGQPRLADQLRNIELLPPAPPDGPPILAGVTDLPPPSAPGTGQAGQQESVLKGLEDLDPKVRAEAGAAKRKLHRDLERWADTRYTIGLSYYVLAHLASNQDRDRDNPQLAASQRQKRNQCLLKVAGALGRALRPSERLLVADMVARGYKDEQIVAELRDLDRKEGQP